MTFKTPNPKLSELLTARQNLDDAIADADTDQGEIAAAQVRYDAAIEGFEDADGNEVPMYIAPGGMLSETPVTSAQLDPIDKAMGKAAVYSAIALSVAMFFGYLAGTVSAGVK